MWMAEEKQHLISCCFFACIMVFWHGENGGHFSQTCIMQKICFGCPRLSLQSCNDCKLWDCSSGLKLQPDNYKVKGWSICLQTPSTWAKLQEEWILHIVFIAYFQVRMCLACVEFPCFLDVRMQCPVGFIPDRKGVGNYGSHSLSPLRTLSMPEEN